MLRQSQQARCTKSGPSPPSTARRKSSQGLLLLSDAPTTSAPDSRIFAGSVLGLVAKGRTTPAARPIKTVIRRVLSRIMNREQHTATCSHIGKCLIQVSCPAWTAACQSCALTLSQDQSCFLEPGLAVAFPKVCAVKRQRWLSNPKPCLCSIQALTVASL